MSFYRRILVTVRRSMSSFHGPMSQCAKLGLTGNDCGPTGCDTVEGALGCGDWTCVCEHFSPAMVALSSIVEGYCSCSQDAASTTSILNGFCAQLTVTGTGPLEPTTTMVLLVSSTVTVPVTVETEVTITPSCFSSGERV